MINNLFTIQIGFTKKTSANKWPILQCCLHRNLDKNKIQYFRDTSTRLRPLSHLPFHFAQTAAFVFLAFIIMRLKLFMTPHLCASVALIMSANVSDL